MKDYLIIFGIISIFLISACASQQPSQPTTQPKAVIGPAESDGGFPEQAKTPVPGQEDAVETAVISNSAAKEFDMTTRQWDWNPRTITVNEGDSVKLNIKNLDVSHGFALFEFGVNERLPGSGAVTTVEFTADKAGEYTFFCSVPCGAGHRDMKGTLIVE